MDSKVRKTYQKLINDAITEVNKARKEFGLGPIELLKGMQTKMNSCPIAKGLGIRNKVTYGNVAVRSKIAAERLSKAWGGTLIQSTESWGKGFKDYKWAVAAPRALGEFVNHFDRGDLTELARTSKPSNVKRKYSSEFALEQSFGKDTKQVSTLVCSADTAKKIVAYL